MGSLFPDQRLNLSSLVVKAWSPDHWTTREFSSVSLNVAFFLWLLKKFSVLSVWNYLINHITWESVLHVSCAWVFEGIFGFIIFSEFRKAFILLPQIFFFSFSPLFLTWLLVLVIIQQLTYVLFFFWIGSFFCSFWIVSVVLYVVLSFFLNVIIFLLYW